VIVFNDQVKIWLDIVWRRKWLIVLPVVIALGAGYWSLKQMPKRYRSSTLILVIGQKVPENFVRPTVTTAMDERMASLSVQILSRSFLESVVKQFGIVEEDAADLQIERACARLARQVQITYDKRKYSWFRIMVTDDVPSRAADVANRLAELFIMQNNEQRQLEATATLKQVEKWLSEKEAEISTVEKSLSEYRGKYLMELPEQLGTNMGLMNAASQQVDSLTSEIESRQARLDLLRAQAAEEPTAPIDALLFPPPTREDPLARQLATLQSELATMLLDLTEAHPDVRRKREQITEFLRAHPELGTVEEKDEEGLPIETSPTSPIETEIARLELELRDLEEQRRKERSKIDLYTGRMERAPMREQELADLTRDVGVLRREYESLQAMKTRAEQGRDLEITQRGEGFRVQDRAVKPGRPFSPKPFNILGLFLAGGFGVGIGLMLLLEMLDQSIRTEVEFRRMYPDLPLLETMPHLADGPPPPKPHRNPFRRRGH
jgi:polysaccharide chain length determinant protein (PEP-CTERM system associated)